MTQRSPARGSFLGTGWSFPPEFSAGGAEVAMVSDVEDVHQALAILCATQFGERPMQEGFGFNLHSVMFEEIDQRLVSRIHSLIRDAVLRYETRVDLVDVDVSQDARDAGVLQVRLEYAVLGTNSRFNMVFPFYLNEASAQGG
jgi:phage baseplate assembly protein W